MEGLSDVLAPLVASAIQFDAVAMLESRRSIAAMIEMQFLWSEQDVLFAGLAALSLSVVLARGDEETVVGQLSDWVLAEHFRLKLEGLSPETGPGVLECTFFDQYHPLWQAIAKRYLVDAVLPYSRPVTQKVRTIGEDLLSWKKPSSSSS